MSAFFNGLGVIVLVAIAAIPLAGGESLMRWISRLGRPKWPDVDPRHRDRS